jgi:peptidoglycan/xylan/chitin deacetylase (PgdA/CDA1 family)
MGFNLRAAALGLLELSGVNYLVHLCNAGKLAVFCYHGVVATPLDRRDPNFETTVGAAEFATHLEFLTRWFQPVTLADVQAAFTEGKRLPRRAALITFDDGYRNVLTHGAPVLARYGVPAAVFVSTAYIGSGLLYWYDEMHYRLLRWPRPDLEWPDGSRRKWPDQDRERRIGVRQIEQSCKRVANRRRLEYLDYVRAHTAGPVELTDSQHHVLDPMNWDEVRRLAQLGIAIGSHTVTHPILTNLTDDELAAEMLASKSEIEQRIGAPCDAIAYPNGTRQDFSGQVLEAARQAGYRLGFTMLESLDDGGNGPYAISRLSVPGHVPLQALRVRASGLHTLLREFASPAAQPAAQRSLGAGSG